MTAPHPAAEAAAAAPDRPFQTRPTLLDDPKTIRKLEINLRRNREQDQTGNMEAGAGVFRYEDWKDHRWNPERYSLLYGTKLWEQADERQRTLLNQLYWVAYYSQIISAEVATIFFNQTSAAGLYAQEDFRLVCDTLDLESVQERAHIATFRRVAEATEHALFGERLFTWPMRGPYAETMVHADTNVFREWWKRLNLYAFGLLSSGNSFIACQYFTIRGVRTLNGKLVQHQLSQYHMRNPVPDTSALPAKISYWHFMDESFHFNSSTIISHDVVRSLAPPTKFEQWVVNQALDGCQRDHAGFSVVINGIFWHDPSLYDTVHRLLRSSHFGMDEGGAREMMRAIFTEESDGLHESFRTHTTARESYKSYVDDMPYVTAENREMRRMGQASVAGWLATNRAAFQRWSPR